MNTEIHLDLFERVRQGDTQAFESLFALYYDRLLAFAYHYTAYNEEACDLVQEVFIALWRKAPELPVSTNVHAYLLVSVKNRCLNYLRGKKVRALYAQNTHKMYMKEMELQSEALGQFPIEKLMHEDLQAQLYRAMETLPEQCRKVFMMRCLQHLSPGIIAERLVISEKTVKNHLTKAIKILRTRFFDSK